MKKIIITALGCLPMTAEIVGVDEFDYPAGSVAGLAGGVGWDYDQNTESDNNGVEPGADGDASDWGGDAVITADGTVLTSSTTALRQYNGPSEGTAVPSEERDGAFRGVGTIYYRVDMTRSSSAVWSGISGYDFGGERIFFGVGGTNAATDTVVIGESGVSETVGTLSLTDDQTHTMIAKIDFDGDLLSLWIDPDMTQDEGSNTPAVTRAYTGTNWNTAVRLGSGGDTAWDNLAVATEWSDLDFTDDDGDGMPNGYENQFGLNPNVNDSLDDLDNDTINNITEFQNGTSPNNDDTDEDGFTDDVENGGGVWTSLTQTGTDPLNPDTDGDNLLDGVETNSGSFSSESDTGTNPHLVDSDTDGAGDGTEVLCGTNPTNPASIPDSGNLDFIGAEYFFYENGNIDGQSGGSGFDYDNDLLGNSFVGHTCIESSWTGTANVSSGRLSTLNSAVFRPLTGSLVSEGAISTVDGASNREIFYARVRMTRRSGAEWGGISAYNGTGNELAFFGANVNGGPPTFAIVDQEQAPGTNYREPADPIILNDEESYEFVAKMEYTDLGVELSLIADPDFSSPEPTPNINVIITPPGEFIMDHIRLNSGGTGAVEWESIVLATTWNGLDVEPTDLDSDGLPDEWENVFGLNVGTNDRDADPDSDNLSNFAEFTNRTDPLLDDTDGDTLTDQEEVVTFMTNPNVADTDGDTIRDDEEVVTGADGFITNPLLVDTDSDGENDGDEIAFGSDPADPESTYGGDRSFIGWDDFNSYEGSLAGLGGGTGFDYDSSPDNDAFTGHTGTFSTWNEDVFGALVEDGKLITLGGTISREFNGPTEGAANGQDERYGAVNETWSTNAVYMKVEMTRRDGAFESRFGSDDFGNFRQAFGVFDIGNGPEWGIAIDGNTASTVASTIELDQPYTLVAKVDYPGDLLTLWVDPTLGDLEANNVPVHTVPYTNTNWASAVQMSSDGTGNTEWDNLVVAREWAGLIQPFGPNPGEGGPRITGLTVNDTVTGATITFDSVPGATYTIERSRDLSGWIVEQDNVQSQGASTTRNITFTVGDNPKQYFRIVREAN
jgi:hypothetical protein